MIKEQPKYFRPLNEASLVIFILFIFIFSVVNRPEFSLPVQDLTIDVMDLEQNPKIDISKSTNIPISYHEALKWESEEKEETPEGSEFEFANFLQKNKYNLPDRFHVSGSCLKSFGIHSNTGEIPLYILFHNLRIPQS
jgi:hypothetical protein